MGRRDSRYYHKLFPQYTISIEYEENEDGTPRIGNREFYHYIHMNTSTQYGKIKIYHYGTQLFSLQVTTLDEHRMIAPCPHWGHIGYHPNNSYEIFFKYYISTELPYLLLCFLEAKLGGLNGQETQIVTRRPMEAVLTFEDECRVEEFINHIRPDL